jgi:ABC-type antimicrobial peptide transport system permease subunit
MPPYGDVPIRRLATFIYLRLLSLVVGIVSGLLPARRASSLDPLVALTAE